MFKFLEIEEYDAELERMNFAVASDNLALQHDNKQLNTLIREYESTLETLMDQFRNRAVRILRICVLPFI